MKVSVPLSGLAIAMVAGAAPSKLVCREGTTEVASAMMTKAAMAAGYEGDIQIDDTAYFSQCPKDEAMGPAVDMKRNYLGYVDIHCRLIELAPLKNELCNYCMEITKNNTVYSAKVVGKAEGYRELDISISGEAIEAIGGSDKGNTYVEDVHWKLVKCSELTLSATTTKKN